MPKLTVHVIEAHDIKAADMGGTSDGYVKLSYFPKGEHWKPSQEHKTTIQKGKVAPVWKEVFHFDVHDEEDLLLMELYDWDRFSKDDFLGEVRRTVGEWKHATDAWIAWKAKPDTHDSSIKGKLHVDCKLE